MTLWYSGKTDLLWQAVLQSELPEQHFVPWLILWLTLRRNHCSELSFINHERNKNHHYNTGPGQEAYTNKSIMFCKHYSNVLTYPSTTLFVVVVVPVFLTGVDSTQNHTVLGNHISWTGRTLWKLHSAINSQKYRILEENSRNYLLLCHQLTYSDEMKSTWSVTNSHAARKSRVALNIKSIWWWNQDGETGGAYGLKNHTHNIIRYRRDNQLVFIRSQIFQLLSRCCWRLSHQWDSSKLKFNSIKPMKWSFPKQM